MKKTNAIRILEKQNIPYQLLPYVYNNDNLDVAKIAADNQLPLASIYKTLVVQGDQNKIVIALVAGNASLSLKKLAKVSENKKMMLLPPTQLQKETGYVRGGCSPIGIKKDFPIIGDTSILELSDLYINAGTKGLLLKIAPQDLSKIIGIKFFDINQ